MPRIVTSYLSGFTPLLLLLFPRCASLPLCCASLPEQVRDDELGQLGRVARRAPERENLPRHRRQHGPGHPSVREAAGAKRRRRDRHLHQLLHAVVAALQNEPTQHANGEISTAQRASGFYASGGRARSFHIKDQYSTI